MGLGSEVGNEVARVLLLGLYSAQCAKAAKMEDERKKPLYSPLHFLALLYNREVDLALNN